MEPISFAAGIWITGWTMTVAEAVFLCRQQLTSDQMARFAVHCIAMWPLNFYRMNGGDRK